LYTKNLGDL
jgi:BRCA1 C Terminus (BRCT) domain